MAKAVLGETGSPGGGEAGGLLAGHVPPQQPPGACWHWPGVLSARWPLWWQQGRKAHPRQQQGLTGLSFLAPVWLSLKAAGCWLTPEQERWSTSC